MHAVPRERASKHTLRWRNMRFLFVNIINNNENMEISHESRRNTERSCGLSNFQGNCFVITCFLFPAEYILPCHRNDPKINICLRGTFNHLRSYLVSGLTDLGVPSIEPLVIPRLAMENGAGPVRVRALFQNITVVGASNYSVGTIE